MALIRTTSPVLSICVLAFVAVQTAISMCPNGKRDSFRNNQPVEIQPCVRTILGSPMNQNPIRAEAIHFACTKVDGITITHFEGNFSSTTGQITCSTRPVYSYVIGKAFERSTEGTVVQCEYRTCVFVSLRKGTLLVTGPAPRNARSSHFIPTTLDPKRARKLDLKAIALTLAKTYANAITEEGEVRRRALLGSVKDDCPFPRDLDPASRPKSF